MYVQYDMFTRHVFSGIIMSNLLLQAFSLSVPSRATKRQGSTLLIVPFARVNAVKNGIVVRLPKHVNRLVDRFPETDMFCDGLYAFRSTVKRFAAAL